MAKRIDNTGIYNHYIEQRTKRGATGHVMTMDELIAAVEAQITADKKAGRRPMGRGRYAERLADRQNPAPKRTKKQKPIKLRISQGIRVPRKGFNTIDEFVDKFYEMNKKELANRWNKLRPETPFDKEELRRAKNRAKSKFHTATGELLYKDPKTWNQAVMDTLRGADFADNSIRMESMIEDLLNTIDTSGKTLRQTILELTGRATITSADVRYTGKEADKTFWTIFDVIKVVRTISPQDYYIEETGLWI